MIKIRVFDTILEHHGADRTTRNSADFWRPFCAASNWEFNYERVHSLADIEFFFGKPIKENVIIFSGHGTAKDGFHLSNGEKIDGNNILKIHKNNSGKIIIFSSCLIGKDSKLIEKIKYLFSANAIFAYQHIMEDRFFFLNESILLTMMDKKFTKGKNFTNTNFDEFIKKTIFMKNMNAAYVQEHPLLMF